MPDLPEDTDTSSHESRPEIPSREAILEQIENHPRGLTHARVGRLLDIYDPQRFEGLRRRLIAMARDGQIVATKSGRYTSLSQVKMVTGKVLGHRDGYGFLARDDGEKDLYLSAHQMRTVFPGDRVKARIDDSDYRGKTNAIITEVLERHTQKLVGRLLSEAKFHYVEVEDTRISQKINVDSEYLDGAKHGQYVVVEITDQPSNYDNAKGKIVEVLGDHGAPGMEIEVAIRQFDIPHEWPQSVKEEIEQFEPDVTNVDLNARKDLRHLPLVTIDGEDARDFDDAVYCERKPSGGWRLYVAIADVSHYVTVGSALDQEARSRGTSVYFPDHVVPMLPEMLSNGLCSLNPNVDRLCMVCEMTISEKGRLSGWQFYEGLMHSHARLTYNKVATLLLDPESSEGQQLSEDYADLLPALHNLYQLYLALNSARTARKAIEFETTETQILFDDQRKIDAIEPVVRNEAHKIIEECMLCANVAAASFLKKQDLPTLLRIHEPPGSKKLENLRAFLGELGLSIEGGEEPSPADYHQLNQRLGDREDKSIIQTMMLRSMSQARYGIEEMGHFGLAYDAYTHFTSPIRRYPDLLIHRAIKSSCLAPTDSKQLSYPYDQGQMVELGEHCSMTERRADEATRDVMSWLKCEYLQAHLGAEFEGLIASVTSFGFFVELKGIFIEGLVHISAIGDDYYVFDQAKQRLLGERTGRRFGLGDTVSVQVARVDLQDRMIDLSLVRQTGSAKKTSGKRSKLDRKALLDKMPSRDLDKPKGKGRRRQSSSTSETTKKPKAKNKGAKRGRKK